ncbi:PAS domain S-box-containing protein [Methylomagnum ishizawai]|uniref:PAS domain S-box-containing protein n=1 Tax=Methylomagnum ishizawai TaxID=1760988 RepID=A0A1Y6D7J2_9GAMM|nr:sigma 54-interacting transcriptional regulator [Methylomagnum ishizawai]SMF96452.1 PAS domain S-box-containing protein [Methylomagnum ishizawai]
MPHFEMLLAELSAQFVNLPSDRVDGVINASLQRIAETLGIDRATLGEVTADGQDGFVTHCYAKACIPPNKVQSVMTEVPLVMKTLFAGETLIVRDVADLEEATDRENFLRYGTRADLVFPLIVGGELRGGLAFSSATPRDWPERVVRGLRLIADVFANALARRRADQALRESEAQMRLAAEAAQVGLWVWDIPGDTLWGTDRARTLYGMAADAPVTIGLFLDRLVPEDRPRVERAIQQALAGGGTYREEYRIRHPDGQTRWICATGQCQWGGDGRPGRMMGAGIDITERKQAETALRRALAEIQTLKDQLQQENVYLRREIEEHQGATRIASRSDSMRRVLAQVGQVAPTPASVLITGETGTGKEVLATALHEASPRRGRAMIRVNCAAIPAALIESELFGREKGAYTGALARQIGRFELADGSTLFLDEVGELPLEAQAKLLRVLQEKEIERLGNPRPIKVDVRLIAATHRDLAREVAAGRFREDLYYRLNVFPLHLPPLRERRDDLPPLVESFVEEFAKAMGKPIEAVAKSSLKALLNYPWPGNIRELRNVIERAVILNSGSLLRIEPPTLAGHPAAGSASAAQAGPATLAEVERSHILRVLEATGWRVRGAAGAAEILGLKPSTLESRMLKLGIRRPV